jgi:hypothetical protein
VLVPIIVIPFFFQIPAVAFALFWFLIQIVQGYYALAAPEVGAGIGSSAHGADAQHRVGRQLAEAVTQSPVRAPPAGFVAQGHGTV